MLGFQVLTKQNRDIKLVLLTATSIISSACSNNITGIYSKVVSDASHPSTKRFIVTLQIFSDTNSMLERKPGNAAYITEVSLRADTEYLNLDGEGFFRPKRSHPVWVTIFPQLKNFFIKNHLAYPHDTLRIKQLLGFPP